MGPQYAWKGMTRDCSVLITLKEGIVRGDRLIKGGKISEVRKATAPTLHNSAFW